MTIGPKSEEATAAMPDLTLVPGRYQFMPDLAPDLFAALKADIVANGVMTPIDIDEDGHILDGHNRYRAWQELRKNEPPPTIVRAGLSEAEKRSFARRMNVLRRHLTRAEMQSIIPGEHVNWLAGHQGYRTPDEWLGKEGAQHRKRLGLRDPSDEFLAGWRDHERAGGVP